MKREMKVILKALVCLCIMLLAVSTEAAGKEVTARGRLARTVEAGGWVLNAAKEKYLLLNANDFRNQNWFREGAEVEATGETRTDVVTTYQEGTPFQVRTMQPASGNTNPQASDLASRTQVSVTGDSLVQAQPDTAIITIAVVTQSASALAAQRDNAQRSDAVVRAVRQAAGAGAEVGTSGYTLQPQRVYRENQPPTIAGYEARNAVTVTLQDLTRVGGVIDAASQAGANNVDSLQFTLRRDRPARDQALTNATREALGKAQTIAQALGGRVVRIINVQEIGGYRPPVPVYRDYAMTARAAEAAPTPIQVGTLDVTSQVQITAEIEVRP